MTEQTKIDVAAFLSGEAIWLNTQVQRQAMRAEEAIDAYNKAEREARETCYAAIRDQWSALFADGGKAEGKALDVFKARNGTWGVKVVAQAKVTKVAKPAKPQADFSDIAALLGPDKKTVKGAAPKPSCTPKK